MDSLFGDTSTEVAKEEELSLFPEEEKQAENIKKKKGRKGLALKLDHFLSDTFEAEEKEATSKKSRLSGLDLLIRQTAAAPAASRLKAPDKRRLTLAFNKAQLARLKKIAEDEGIFLKDLINQLIDQYLEQRDE